MNNPGSLATLGTQDRRWWQKKQETPPPKKNPTHNTV